MSFLDYQLQLASAQAFTASGATTSYLDSGVARNLGSGEPMAMVFTVTTAADHTTGDETYAFALQSDSDSAFGTVATHLSTAPAATALTVGTQVVIPFNPTQSRYIRGYATLGGTTPSVSVDCDIMPLANVRKDALYAAGFTIA